jgi:outer membrane protein assembly factor BamB
MKRYQFAWVLAAGLICARGVTISMAADNVWPSFQGIGRVAAGVDVTMIPLEWTDKKNVAWVADLPGYGQCSPVVWGGNVFLTSIDTPTKQQQRVICVDLKTGSVRWVYDQNSKHESKNADMMSRSAPTPVVDEKAVYASFEVGDVVALSHTGEPLWKVDLVERYGEIQSNHGLSSSLAQSDDAIFAWVQRSANPYITALDKKSGVELWKVDTPPGTSWSSPVMVPMLDGSVHLVVSSSGRGAPRPPRGADGVPAGEAPAALPPTPGYLLGLDPETGRELWRLEGLTGNSSPTPCIVAPGKLIVGASPGREGGPSKEAIGTNGLVEIKKEGDAYKAEYVWRATKANCGFCSPVVYQGLAYFADRQGIVHCLEADTGKEVFIERLNQSVWATPLAIGGRIYFVGETGKTEVIKAGREVERLASNELWSADESPAPSAPPGRPEGRGESAPTMAKARQYAVIVAKDTLLIRRGDKLYALRSSTN